MISIPLLSFVGARFIAPCQEGRDKSRPYILILLLLAVTASADNAIPAALQGVDIQQRLNTQVPLYLHFKDENGKDVALANLLQGKPAILNLVYYECPMLCTQVLTGLVTTLKPITFTPGEEFNILTISFNPAETPALAYAKKQTYLKSYGRKNAEKGWFFLTGKPESINELTKSVGFQYKYDTKINQYAHGTVIMILTPEGRVSRYFYGIEYPSRDVRLALIEASQNKIGTLADKVLLFCFHYDPSVGRYSATIINIVRAGGILTVLSLCGFILVMRHKDKTHHV
jgi:protein SCO1/2